jgi:hypothetical protein
MSHIYSVPPVRCLPTNNRQPASRHHRRSPIRDEQLGSKATARRYARSRCTSEEPRHRKDGGSWPNPSTVRKTESILLATPDLPSEPKGEIRVRGETDSLPILISFISAGRLAAYLKKPQRGRTPPVNENGDCPRNCVQGMVAHSSPIALCPDRPLRDQVSGLWQENAFLNLT